MIFGLNWGVYNDFERRILIKNVDFVLENGIGVAGI